MKTAYRWMAVSVAAGVVMSGMTAFGQEAGGAPMPPPGRGSMAPGMPGVDAEMRGKWAERMMNGGMSEQSMIERLLNKSELTSQIGLTDEQIATLKKAVEEMRKQQKDLRVEQEKAGLDQARLMLETNVNEEAVMAAVEKAGKAATDMAKLPIKQLLLMRKTLTAEQMGKVKDLIQQRVRKMQEEREKGDRGMGRGGPGMKGSKWTDRGQGRGGRDAGTNRPPMPPAPPPPTGE